MYYDSICILFGYIDTKNRRKSGSEKCVVFGEQEKG